MFGRKIKSEIIKFLSSRQLIICFIGVLFLIPFMVSALREKSAADNIAISNSKLLQGLYMGQSGYVVIAALFYGQEFSGSTLRTSLLVTQNRLIFLLTKSICLLLCTTVVFIISALASLIILHNLYDAGFSYKILKNLIPTFISILELTVITSCIVTITRSVIASIAIMLSLILGLGNLLTQYVSSARFLPVISSMNSFLPLRSSYYLSVNSGLICQGIWCIVLFAVSFIMFRIRPVR